MSYLKKQKIILIIIIVLALLTSIFLKSKNNEVKELPKVKLKEQQNIKRFALMVEQTKGKGDYQESDFNALPLGGYKFNAEKSGCVDANGKIINDALNYDYNNYAITLNTNKTSYCYLYYDKDNIINYIQKYDENNNLTNELVGDMYRYQGTDDVANWICFGTTNLEECINNIDKYMYRIIGITPNGQLYLLKETFIKEGNIDSFVWNDEYSVKINLEMSCPKGVCPGWNESDLFQRINGIANGTNSGSGGYNSKADTDIFVDNSYYDYLKSGGENEEKKASDWYNLIENHEWYYGDTIIESYNGNTLYNVETGVTETSYWFKNETGTITLVKHKRTEKVPAKISLMYKYDVAYAYPGGNPGSDANVLNSWIHFRKDGYNLNAISEWLSTSRGIGDSINTAVSAYRVAENGILGYNGLIEYNGVRPVFYLTNEIELTGEGTKENPFIIPNL